MGLLHARWSSPRRRKHQAKPMGTWTNGKPKISLILRLMLANMAYKKSALRTTLETDQYCNWFCHTWATTRHQVQMRSSMSWGIPADMLNGMHQLLILIMMWMTSTPGNNLKPSCCTRTMMRHYRRTTDQLLWQVLCSSSGQTRTSLSSRTNSKMLELVRWPLQHSEQLTRWVQKVHECHGPSTYSTECAIGCKAVWAEVVHAVHWF